MTDWTLTNLEDKPKNAALNNQAGKSFSFIHPISNIFPNSPRNGLLLQPPSLRMSRNKNCLLDAPMVIPVETDDEDDHEAGQ